MSFNWKSIVKTIAPVLGTAIGGPFGGIASKAIQTALGVEDEVGIAEELQNNPDALLKLKNADQAFDAEMKKLDVDIMKIDADDRNSARTMATTTSMKPQVIIATLYNGGFMLIIYAVFFSTLELIGTQKDIALYLLGILSAGLVQINNFFFGSSVGSKTKTDKLGIPK